MDQEKCKLYDKLQDFWVLRKKSLLPTNMSAIFLKPLILRAQSTRKIKGFRTKREINNPFLGKNTPIF